MLLGYDNVYATISPGASTTVLVKALPDYATELVVSSDGSKVAFYMTGSTWLMNVDGTGLKRLNLSDEEFLPSDFSPDGKLILLSRSTSSREVWAVLVDAEEVPVGYGGILPSSAFRLTQADGSPLFATGRVYWRR